MWDSLVEFTFRSLISQQKIKKALKIPDLKSTKINPDFYDLKDHFKDEYL